MENPNDLFLVRVIDDDPDVRESLEIFLEGRDWDVVTYSSAEDFLAKDRFLIPGCFIVDVKMPGMDGVELQQKLLDDGLDLFFIFLTAHGNIDMAVNVMRKGARDFFQKPVDPEFLCQRLEEVRTASILKGFGFSSLKEVEQRFRELSEREQQLLKILVLGDVSNKDIGERLGLSERTIEGHRSNLYRKLHVHDVRNLKKLNAFLRSAKKNESGNKISNLNPFESNDRQFTSNGSHRELNGLDHNANF